MRRFSLRTSRRSICSIMAMFSLALGLCATGCATGDATSAKPSGPHAECTVCSANGDLACIDVAIDDTTPRTAYAGKTYFFCSDDCRKSFEKHPEKFAAAH